MKNLDTVAQELFNKVRGRFPSVTIGDGSATITNEPSKSRFFEFNFASGKKVNITLDERDLTIMYSKNLFDEHETVLKDKWFDFLKELRQFAKKRMLNFDTRDITKSNLDKRDYQYLSTEKQMSESKMYGTSRTSYQDLGTARMVVKHASPINQESPAGRTQQVHSIYIESEQGERFKYPFRHLNGARAMARHVAEGGNPFDSFGKHITSLSEELANLRKFKTYMNRSNVMAEGLAQYLDIVNERIETVKKTVESYQKAPHYQTAVENFQETVLEDVPTDVSNNWIDELTIRQFNEDLKDVFPYIYRLVSEANKVKELGPEDLLGEAHAEPEDPDSMYARLMGDINEIQNGAMEGNDMADFIMDQLGDYLRNGDAPEGSHYEKAIGIIQDALHDGPQAQADAAEEAGVFLHSEEEKARGNPNYEEGNVEEGQYDGMSREELMKKKAQAVADIKNMQSSGNGPQQRFYDETQMMMAQQHLDDINNALAKMGENNVDSMESAFENHLESIINNSKHEKDPRMEKTKQFEMFKEQMAVSSVMGLKEFNFNNKTVAVNMDAKLAEQVLAENPLRWIAQGAAKLLPGAGAGARQGLDDIARAATQGAKTAAQTAAPAAQAVGQAAKTAGQAVGRGAAATAGAVGRNVVQPAAKAAGTVGAIGGGAYLAGDQIMSAAGDAIAAAGDKIVTSAGDLTSALGSQLSSMIPNIGEIGAMAAKYALPVGLVIAAIFGGAKLIGYLFGGKDEKESADTVDLSPKGKGDEMKQKNEIPLDEFVKSLYDYTSNTFPKGETAVLTQVQKQYGDSAVGEAQAVMNELVSGQDEEMARIAQLAGIR